MSSTLNKHRRVKVGKMKPKMENIECICGFKLLLQYSYEYANCVLSLWSMFFLCFLDVITVYYWPYHSSEACLNRLLGVPAKLLVFGDLLIDQLVEFVDGEAVTFLVNHSILSSVLD